MACKILLDNNYSIYRYLVYLLLKQYFVHNILEIFQFKAETAERFSGRRPYNHEAMNCAFRLVTLGHDTEAMEVLQTVSLDSIPDQAYVASIGRQMLEAYVSSNRVRGFNRIGKMAWFSISYNFMGVCLVGKNFKGFAWLIKYGLGRDYLSLQLIMSELFLIQSNIFLTHYGLVFQYIIIEFKHCVNWVQC